MKGKKKPFTGGIILFLSGILFLLIYICPVRAAEVEERKDCSLTLLLGEGEDHLQNPLRGGSVGLYKIASVHFGEDIYFDAAEGQFASSKTLANLKNLSKKELDANNSALTAALLEEARAENIQPMKTADIREGKVRFDGLSVGLYLLTQTVPSEGGRLMNSFLISIPDAEGSYEIVAAPKPGITAPAVTPTLTPTPPPFIPQTGQLWWPVPILAIAGLGFLALGFFLRAKARG